ncbi:MAG TPA: DUF2252 family protein [Puia sp.]|jgi:uncharacterized protein (DUF2252 family)|nr:DUF2252 family protein [Puia sp.]
MNSVLQRIKEFNNDRLPDMVELKYEAMLQNLFRFYRGANHLFYEDLQKTNTIPNSPTAWICGDLHLENFGSYKGSNRLVYFDLNDFDESVLAPASWELLRMVTSIFVAFESLNIEQKKALNMAALFLKTYSSVLAEGKPDYIEPRTAKGIVCEFLTEVSKRKQKEILRKRTVQKKNKLEILMDDPRHFELDKKLKRDLSAHINRWLKNDGNSPYNYKVIDAVFRLAGTGSVGLKRYAFLLRSLNETGDKYMMIDMKQSTQSALKTYLNLEQPTWISEAERIVSVQKRMQNREPALLSTTIYNGEAYVIQEMQPTKDSINFKLIKKEYRNIYQVIHDMAMLTASSQLRSSGRQGSATTDELIAFGKDDSWREAILDYSLKYSRQVQSYYRQFKNEHKNN